MTSFKLCKFRCCLFKREFTRIVGKSLIALLWLSVHAFLIHDVIGTTFFYVYDVVATDFELTDMLIELSGQLPFLTVPILLNLFLYNRKLIERTFKAVEDKLNCGSLNYKSWIFAWVFVTLFATLRIAIDMYDALKKDGTCKGYIEANLYNSAMLLSHDQLGVFVCFVENFIATAIPATSFAIQIYFAVRIGLICNAAANIAAPQFVHLYQDFFELTRNLSQVIDPFFVIWLIEWSTAFIINLPIALKYMVKGNRANINLVKFSLWLANSIFPIFTSINLMLNLAQITSVAKSVVRWIYAEWDQVGNEYQIHKHLILTKFESAPLEISIYKCFTVYKGFAFDFYFALVTYIVFITQEIKTFSSE